MLSGGILKPAGKAAITGIASALLVLLLCYHSCNACTISSAAETCWYYLLIMAVESRFTTFHSFHGYDIFKTNPHVFVT